MCYYRYHYYSQCAHQELFCFRFCNQASDLAGKSIKKEQPDHCTKIQEAGQNNDNNDKSRHKPQPQPNSRKPPSSDKDSILASSQDPTSTQRDSIEIIHHNPSFALHHHHKPLSTSPPSPPSLPHHSSEYTFPPIVSQVEEPSMPSKKGMTVSSRVTHAGLLGVQPHQLGCEVWGDNVRPLRHMGDNEISYRRSDASFRDGYQDTYPTRTLSTSDINHDYHIHDDYASIEAELDSMKKHIRDLRNAHQRHPSGTSDITITPAQTDFGDLGYDSESRNLAAQESAAARLQKLHERSDHSSPRHIFVDTCSVPALESESFPVLGDAPLSRQRNNSSTGEVTCGGHSSAESYARVVKDSHSLSSPRIPSPAKTICSSRATSPTKQNEERILSEYAHGFYADTVTSPSTKNMTTDSFCGHTCHLRPADSLSSCSSTTAKTLCDNINYPCVTEEYEDFQLLSNTPCPGDSNGFPRFTTERRVADRFRRTRLPEQWVLDESDKQSSGKASKMSRIGSSVKIDDRNRTLGHGGDVAEYGSRRQYQATREPIRHLTKAKSHGNLTSPTKSTIGRKSNFASPTAASKQRSTALPKSANPSDGTRGSAKVRRTKSFMFSPTSPLSPVKAENSRRNTKATLARSVGFRDTSHSFQDCSKEENSGSRSATFHITDATLSSASALKSLRKPSEKNVSLQELSENHRSSERNRLRRQLKILIPDIDGNRNHASSPASPSRIPRPLQTLQAPPSSPVPSRSEHSLKSKVNLKYESQPQSWTGQSAPVVLSGERAPLLHCIVRRLSSAGSGSLGGRSRSGTSCSTATPTIRESNADTPVDTIADKLVNDPTSDCAGPTNSVSSTIQPAVSTAFSTASSWLLGSIRQTAADFAKRQEQGEKQIAPVSEASGNIGREEPASEQTLPEKALIHEESHDSAVALSEQDPAVVAIGPVRTKPFPRFLPQQDPAVLAFDLGKADGPEIPQMIGAVSEQCFSLRATAPMFVPCSLTEASEQQSELQADSDATFPPFEREQQLITPIDHHNLPPSIPQQLEDPSDSLAWISQDDWNALTTGEREHIREKRRERASSSASSGGLSSTDNSPPSGQYDWFTAACYGSPVRFSRAPLPSMSEEHVKHGKGWGIGSAAPGWWYGWRGGDGLEISFVGHGPDAEKNPSAPINFHNYQRGTTAQGSLISSQQTPRKHGSYGGGDDIPTAPRKMRDWATKMGYPQVPCGDFEITHAVEHIGNEATRYCLDGWCHECVSAH